MRTFAAAAIAASATAFDAKSIPEFIAGFMYGMTGDNNLTEIEACYQGGQQIVTDSQTAVADMKAGDYFKGIKDAGTVWNELHSAMSTCQGMDDDVAEIEAWAQIFKQPTTLAKTVAKHWLLHSKKIKADITKEESDWSSGDYFNAGADVADALTLAVGPMKPSYETEVNMDLEAPFLFVGGLMEGLVGDNHLTEISSCITDAEAVVKDVEAVVGDVESKKWIKAAEAVKTTVQGFETALKDCEGMDDDVQAIKQWSSVFHSKAGLIEQVSKHMLFHASEIKQDVSDVKTEWNGEQYFQSGKSAADLLTVAIGPIKTTETEDLGLDLMMLPDLAAGFVYGMVGDNKLTEFEACYSGVAPLEQYLMAALKDVEGFHLIKALKQFELFVYNLQTDVAPCENMGDDIKKIEQWAQIFKTPKDLITTATKHYLFHKADITTDIASIKSDFGAKSYFKTGKDAADMLTLLVGPIQ